jgi:hypothetical protein
MRKASQKEGQHQFVPQKRGAERSIDQLREEGVLQNVEDSIEPLDGYISSQMTTRAKKLK